MSDYTDDGVVLVFGSLTDASASESRLTVDQRALLVASRNCPLAATSRLATPTAVSVQNRTCGR